MSSEKNYDGFDLAEEAIRVGNETARIFGCRHPQPVSNEPDGPEPACGCVASLIGCETAIAVFDGVFRAAHFCDDAMAGEVKYDA